MANTNVEQHTIGYTKDGNQIVEKSISVHTRKMDRMIIDNKFKKQGMVRYRKHGYNGDGHRKTKTPSEFAKRWKGYAAYV